MNTVVPKISSHSVLWPSAYIRRKPAHTVQSKTKRSISWWNVQSKSFLTAVLFKIFGKANYGTRNATSKEIFTRCYSQRWSFPQADTWLHCEYMDIALQEYNHHSHLTQAQLGTRSQIYIVCYTGKVKRKI